MNKVTPITEMNEFFPVGRPVIRQGSVIALRAGETPEQAAERAARIKQQIESKS